MAISNFIPTVWSARLLHNLTTSSAFMALSNRDYESDLSGQGNKVKIFGLDDDVTIRDYSRTTDIAVPETLNTTEQELTLDQEKYFNFSVEDLDRVQARGELMDRALSNTTNKLRGVVDTYAKGRFDAIANDDLGHRDTTARAFALSVTTEVKQFAQSEGIPIGAMNLILSRNHIGALDGILLSGGGGDNVRSQQVRNQGTAASDINAQINGFYGTINGVNIYGSGVLDKATSSNAYAFDSRDWTMVVQVNKVEAYRPERRFSDAVKGLTNYAGLVTGKGRVMKFDFTNV